MLASHGKVLNHGFGINAQSILLGQKGHLAFCGFKIENPHSPGDFIAQDNILGNTKGLDQHEMLMHHADPVFNGHVGISNLQGLAVYANAAAGGFVKPVQHIHQGCLARTVFPQKGMNFPFMHGQVDPVIGSNISKFLDHIHHLNGLMGKIYGFQAGIS